MIEYTNSLEGALDEVKEYAASMSTTQDKNLQNIDEQQKRMMEQTNKFMQKIVTNNSMKWGDKNDESNNGRCDRGGTVGASTTA